MMIHSIQQLLENDRDQKPISSLIMQKKKHNNDDNNNKSAAEDDEEEDDEEIEGIEDKRRLQPKFDNKTDSELYEKRKQNCSMIKYSILLFMFILCTCYQGYIGIKCVTFDFKSNNAPSHYETWQAILFGICVICINIEIFLFKNFIESATDVGDCILVKSLHPHPLKQRKKVKFWCDLCRSRAKFCTYRCDNCHFDVCSDCYKKEKKKLKMKAQKQNASSSSSSMTMKDGGKLFKNIRINAASETYEYDNIKHAPENDPTAEQQKKITSTRYMLRALSLCRPHALLIIIAFSCLLINSVSNLLLPRSQGHILDEIVNDNHSEFIYQIKYFLVLSIIVGLFGSIRNLCFAFTIRKLMVSI